MNIVKVDFGEAQIAGKPVGEWVCALHANQSELPGIYIEALEQRAQRAESLVSAYEQGRFMRLMRALKHAARQTNGRIVER